MDAMSMAGDNGPRGAFLVLMGPDGVGEATVARALTVTSPVFGYLPPFAQLPRARSPSTRGLGYYRAWLYRLQP
jgi:hypothetical protein